MRKLLNSHRILRDLQPPLSNVKIIQRGDIMAGPLPQPNPNPAPAPVAPPIDVVEAMRQAWHSNNRIATIFPLLAHLQVDWQTRAAHLLSLFRDEGVETSTAIAAAADLNQLMEANMTRQRQWQLFMAPRILQLQNGETFRSHELVAITATADLDSPLPNADLDRAVSWLDDWNRWYLRAAVDFGGNNPLGVLLEAGFSVLIPPANGHQAPIFHPLVLRSLRRLLKEDAFAPVVLELCEWLLENIFVSPIPIATVETVFATGPLLLDMASKFRGDIVGAPTPSQVRWRKLEDTVVTTIVTNSVGTPDVLPLWRGQQDTVRKLVDACSYWHARELAGVLRSRAVRNLSSELDALKGSLADQSAELSKKGLMPEDNGTRIFVAKPQDYARRPLPSYRGATTKAWDQDPDRQPYSKVLQTMDASSRRLAAASSTVQEVANDLVAKRKAFERELGNPWMQAALPDHLQGGLDDLVVDNHAVRHYLKEQLGMARVDFRAYDNGRLIVDTPAWSTAVNAPAEAATMLAAWAKLEVWDKFRGRMLSDAQLDAQVISTTLLAELDAKWELDLDKPAPAEDTLDAVRPVLAAAAHLGLAGDQMVSRAGALDDYLKSAVLNDAQFTALAAMRLELGITMVVTESPIGIAFPQVVGGLEKILGWAGRCLASKNAWEARAGMNTFILLARLAETSDDLFFTTPLASAIGPAIDVIQQSVTFIKDGKPVPGSDLALAFVASDLLRYTAVGQPAYRDWTCSLSGGRPVTSAS